MSDRLALSAVRAACAVFWLAGFCVGDVATDNATPAIRRIYVPAASPVHWPTGAWEPMPLADLERRLASRRRDRIQSLATRLERAEYRARLVGDTLQQGSFEWTLSPEAARGSFLPLDPLNLAISRLEWVDARSRSKIGSVIWGTTPSNTAGLLMHHTDALGVGAWSLLGRSLARSTEFELRIPSATVSYLVLQVPDELVPSVSSGELSGPRPSETPGWSLWELHLGSRTSCRLRFSPPMAETARRSLVVTRSRTNYVVRPEVVRVLAEFDLEVHETAVRDVRLQVDEGLQVIGVEYGDDDEVAWRELERSDGRAILIHLPDALTGSGQVLRVRGIAPGKPLLSWSIPRVRLADAVELEAKVTLRLQPPYLAADLRLDGYRQTELIASPTDGETVVLRQLKAGASLVVVPSSPRLVASCRSVAVARLEGEEWTLTALVHLRATAGSAFEVHCPVPEGWEIVNVQDDGEPGRGDLAGWDVVTAADRTSRLQLDFLTALGATHPQQVRVTARRNPVEREREIAVPSLICTDAVEVDAVTIILDGPEQRAVLQKSAGWEVATITDLSATDQALDFLRTLPAAARSSAVVLRTTVVEASGTLVLRGLDTADPAPVQEDKSPVAQPIDRAESPKLDGDAAPVVAAPVDVRVLLDGADTGFDLFQVDAVVFGREGAKLPCELPHNAEIIGVRLNGRAVEPQFVGGGRTLRLPASTADHQRRHDLSLEYRIPISRRFGPNQRRLPLPQLQQPTLGCRVAVFIPRNLRVVGPAAGIELKPQPVETQSIFGPLARRSTESVFRPFDATAWRRMWEPVDATDGRSAMRADPPSSHSRVAPRPFAAGQLPVDAIGETWIGSSLTLPDSFELTVWNREQAASLNWAAWWLSLLTTVALRTTAIRGRRWAAAVCCGVLAGAIWACPQLYPQLAGSALIGIAIGTLLPQRLLLWRRPAPLADRSSVPGGSTRSFETALGLWLAAALPLAYSARAQDERRPIAASTTPESARTRDRIDVLVPVGADGRPTGKVPLCYVPADVLRQLNRTQFQHALPPYLLNAAAFDATVVDGRQVEITARFDVFVLADDDPVRVNLPLSNVVLGGADACHVDGRPHAVLLGPNDRGLIVELAGRSERPFPPPLPENDSAAAPPSAQEKPSMRESVDPAGFALAALSWATAPSLVPHRIELRLYPQVELETNETFVARLRIPAVSDTSVEFTAKGASPLLSAPPLWDEMPQSFRVEPATPSRVVARLRPTGELQLRWSRSRSTGQTPSVELTASVKGLVDVSPALAIANYQVEYRVHAGRVDSVAWKLPRGSTLVSLQSPGLSGHVIESSANGDRRMFVEFATPQSGVLLVTATFAQPLPLGAAEFDLPLLDLDAASDRNDHTTLGRYQIAFRPPVDFRLSDVVAPAEMVLKPRPIDDWPKEWPFSGVPPQRAYELIRPGTLRLSLQDLPAGLSATMESRGRFKRGRLEWSFQAEIAEAPVPPFQYRLRVDPRLRIRKVVVQEEGADRLLRWSHVNDSLVLFLVDRAIRPQTLRVDASLPIATLQEVELPLIELAGAPAGPKAITLTRAPDMDVALLGEIPRNAADRPASPADRDRTGESPLVARIEVPAGAPLPRVRVRDAAPVIAADVVTILHPAGDGNQLTAAIEYIVRSERVFQFELDLPADFAQRARFETSRAAQTIRRSAGGGRTSLIFFPLQPVTDRFRVTLKAPVPLSAEGAWMAPVLTTPGIPMEAQALILPREQIVDLAPGAFPDWALTMFDGEFDFARFNCYRRPAAESSPTIRISDQRSGELPEMLADVSLEFDDRGALRGRYVLWLSDRPPATLVFDWPEHATPLAAFVDDLPQPVTPPAEGEWTMPLPRDAAPRLVCVTWIDRSGPEIGILGKVRPPMPALRNGPVTTQLSTTKLPPRLLSRRQLHLTGAQDLEFALARWQAALSALQRPLVRTDGDEKSWLVDYLQSVSTEATRLDSTEAQSPLLHQRIEQLRDRTAALKLADSAGQSRDVDSFVNVLPGGRRDRGLRVADAFWQLSTKSGSSDSVDSTIAAGGWAFDRRALDALLGFLVAILVGWIAWKSGPLWQWLQQREALAWIVLGLFWWLALKPGLFGLFMIAWGALGAVRHAKRPERPATEFEERSASKA